MTERDYERHQLATREAIQAREPFVRELMRLDLLFAKHAISVSQDGTIEHRTNYPPEIEKFKTWLEDMAKAEQEKAWRNHFPVLPRAKEAAL